MSEYGQQETVIGIVAGVINDFAKQQVPGSVVLVILAIVMLRELMGIWKKWREPK